MTDFRASPAPAPLRCRPAPPPFWLRRGAGVRSGSAAAGDAVQGLLTRSRSRAAGRRGRERGGIPGAPEPPFPQDGASWGRRSPRQPWWGEREGTRGNAGGGSPARREARCPARRLRPAARWGRRPLPRGGASLPPAGGFPARRRYVRAEAGARGEAGAARPRGPPSLPPGGAAAPQRGRPRGAAGSGAGRACRPGAVAVVGGSAGRPSDPPGRGGGVALRSRDSPGGGAQSVWNGAAGTAWLRVDSPSQERTPLKQRGERGRG